MSKRHRLLRRQLRKCFDDEGALPETVAPLLDMVDQAYRESEQHRCLLERSLELTSNELLERNAQLEQDLAARVSVEAALRDSEARLRAILSGLPDSVYVVDPNGTLVAAHITNPVLPRVQLGDNLFAAIPDDRRDAALAQAKMATTERRIVEDEFERDGRWVNVRFVPDGSYLTLVLRDVTEQRTLEQQMIVSERMATIGTLVAGVAHEINNPLAYLVSNLTYARGELELLGAESELIEALTEAEMGAARVQNIVADLRALSRGSGETEVRAVDVRSTIAAATSIVRVKLDGRTRLRVDIDDMAWVKADESQLAQVLLNLLVNAAQAIPAGTAGIHYIDVRSRTRDDEVEIEVTDDGPGIPPAVQPRLFEPFFTTKSLGKGTGLGLAISRRLIEGFGGRLIHVPTPIGACFRVTLARATPIRPSAISSPPALARPAAPSPEQGCVLVIDDEVDLGRAIRRVLKGHDVTVTASGQEGLRLMLDGHFDVVFCDLMMPNFAGYDVYEHLATSAPQLLECVVFMTGGALTDAAQRFIEAGSAPCIKKPFDPGVLRDHVAQAIRRRRTPSATAIG